MDKKTGESSFGKGEAGPAGSSRDVWLIRFLIGGAVLAAIGLGFGIRIGMAREKVEEEVAQPQQEASRSADPDPEADPAVKAAVKEATKALNSEDRAIRRFLGKFLGAQSWRERLPLVRHPEITGERMSEYYKDHEDGPFQEIVISTRVTRVASLIVLTLEGKKLPSKRLILEEQGGGYRVDWEAFVLWQDRPWAEIPTMEEGETCEIRCLARPLPNNHPSRRAEEGWLAYELVNPVTHEILFGFFQKKEGHAADSPAEVFAKGSSGPVTLLLKPIVGESGTDQVMISEVLALGWVYPLPEGHRKK